MEWLSNLTREEQFQRVYDGWLGTARSQAYQFGFRGEDLADLVQALFSNMWERDYLSLYDPSKSKFDTFVYVFIRREIFTALRKLSRDVMAKSISLLERRPNEDSRNLALETLEVKKPGEPSVEDRVAFRELIAQALVELEEYPVYAYRLYNEKTGEVVERSERQVLLFLLDGTWGRDEMAIAMGCSEGRLSQLISDLSSRPCMRRLREVFRG